MLRILIALFVLIKIIQCNVLIPAVEPSKFFECDDTLNAETLQNFGFLNKTIEELHLKLDALNRRLDDKTVPSISKEEDGSKETEKQNIYSIFTATTEDNASSKDSLKNSVPGLIPAKLPRSCAEVAQNISNQSGIYTILVDDFETQTMRVYCDNEQYGGGWTVIQRRQDGSVNFFRDWNTYKRGFGLLNGEFFIGLDNLYTLTESSNQELLIVMEDFDRIRKFARYNAFVIGNEKKNYVLSELGTYTGDAGDSMRYHKGSQFYTKDRDNSDGCAVARNSGWWFDYCSESNLNGKYLRGSYSEDNSKNGVTWKEFRGFFYSLKYVQMMLRPREQ